MIPNPVFLETFKAFKANPVPMPFAELYGALEAKAVDGQENPFAVILSNKFSEVNKFVSATNHVSAANEARAYQRQMSRTAASTAVKERQAKGMQYNELTPAAANVCFPPSRKSAFDLPFGFIRLRRMSSMCLTLPANGMHIAVAVACIYPQFY